MALVSLYSILLIFLLVLHPSAEENKYHPSCPPFACGKLGEIGFPFTNATHPECGLCIVDGCTEPVQKIRLERGGEWYEVESISQSSTIRISDKMLQKSLQSHQCESFKNLTLPSSPSISFQITPNLTLFKCCHTLNITPSLNYNYTGCPDYNIFYSHPDKDLPSLPPLCSILQLPVSRAQINSDLFASLTSTYTLEVHVSSICYECYHLGGQCQLESMGKFQCANVTTGNDRNLVMKAATATAAAGITILMVLVCCLRRFLASYESIFVWKKETQNHQGVEAFLWKNGSLAPKKYSYKDIKKMTNSFGDKLGQGGYGGVFKGKLQDGRLVAVKVLNESKGNGEEFINEVASISKTSHVNIVNLLGFCFEGKKKALIYEFMPNGSLEKFRYEDNSTKADHQLGWETLYQITIGIARGLEYLHRGCNTRILHFDIKPHNILLDENFCPKISDFGLAKICPRKESIISMTGARGTAGYIAPEVFCRNFGRVSHKSDVYSYGMMILEMVGGRKIIDIGVDHISEIYFPQWIYMRLELDEELGVQGIMNEEDEESARKMIIVGLWCIQTDLSNRPPMSRVVEMLEGSIESLQIPPKPFLSSPPRSPTDSSTTLASERYYSATY